MNFRTSLALLLTLGVSATATSLDAQSCATGSHCHLPRWVPDGAQAFDNYGRAVAIDGDTAAVGGSDVPVVIYRKSDDGWTQTQVLPNPHGASSEWYGHSLSLDGDLLAVGANGNSDQGSYRGAVYVFERTDDVWAYAETIYSPNADDSGFGVQVDVDGPWLGVATTGGVTSAARVQLYLRTFDQWTHHREFGEFVKGADHPSVAIREVEPGLSVRVLVGRPGYDGPEDGAGAATLYTVMPAFLGSQPIQGPDLHADDHFGKAVALDDDLMLIGATGDDTAGPNRGAVHAYSIEAHGHVPAIEYLDALYSCDHVTHAGFGSVLELSEGRAAIGFDGHETPDDPGGAVYVFGYAPGPFGGWSPENVFVPEGIAPFALLGQSVALQANALLCGAVLEQSEAGTTGAAYFVSLTPEEMEGGECPCTELAEWGTYGAGKPGSAGVPMLSLSRELVPGETSIMKLDDVLVGGAPLLAWGLVPAEIPFDEGTFLIADPRFVALPVVPPFGQVGIGVDVPDHPFMCGLELYFQALLIDPTASGTYSTAQSNGVAVTVGY